MRSSSDIFRAIRTEVFRETQPKFGKKLQLSKETVCRLEKRAGHHHVTRKHLRVLRQVPAPPHQADRYHALLDELAKAIEEESRPEGYLEEEQRRLAEEARRADELRRAEEAARLSHEALQSAEQRRQADAEHLAAALRKAEEVAQLVQESLRRAEAHRAEELRRLEDSAHRAEEAAQLTQQLCRVEAERRSAEAQQEAELRAAEERERAEQAQKLEQLSRRMDEADQWQQATERASRLRRAEQRLNFAAVVTFLLLAVAGGRGELSPNAERPSIAQGESMPAERKGLDNPELSPYSPSVAGEEDELLSQGALNSNVDGGVILSKLATEVLPIPKGPAVRGHLAAPCPEVAEEINGYCWARWSLTPAQVKAGACDRLALYEPSDGWCRAHHAGYKPWLEMRSRNNSVDPQ